MTRSGRYLEMTRFFRLSSGKLMQTGNASNRAIAAVSAMVGLAGLAAIRPIVSNDRFRILSAERRSLNLKQQAGDRQTGHAQQCHRWCDLMRSEAHAHQVKILQRVVHIRRIDPQTRDIT